MTSLDVSAVGTTAISGVRRPPRAGLVAIAIAILATIGAAVGVAVDQQSGTGQHAAGAASTQLTLGRSLHPLTVYRVASHGIAQPTPAAHRGQRVFPAAGVPSRTRLVAARPVARLRVRFADVRTGDQPAQIEFFARPQTLRPGTPYVAVVRGQAYDLFFVSGSNDGTDFAIGSGPNPVTLGHASAVARYLTSSVATPAGVG